MNLQNPGMANRLSDLANGSGLLNVAGPGSSAPGTPNVARRYYEMKYGDKTASNMNPLTTRNGNPPNKSSMQTNVAAGSGTTSVTGIPITTNTTSKNNPPPPPSTTSSSSTFNFRNKLPNSIQNTLATTSQSLQSKLPASLQKLPTSLTQGPTINMLASKFQNAFS